MDVSRYDFACQKALHLGLQYARSLGHQVLEVEHVALALLRMRSTPLAADKQTVLRLTIEGYLARAPRVFGGLKIEFGRRLEAALDRVEDLIALPQTIDEGQLWECICKESTVIRNFFVKDSPQQAAPAARTPKTPESSSTEEEDVFEPLIAPKAKDDGSVAAGGHRAAAKTPTVLSEKHLAKLKPYAVDLSEKAERNELDPVLGRDAEVRRALEILGRKKKNNPILIGEPGVGKSAIADAIAIRIAQGKVAESIRSKRIFSLDLGSMLAGTRFRGEFEARIKGVIEAVEASAGQIILFIDEIHMLVGAGNPEGSADAANLLKPALARGDIRCLGATTLDEYRQFIEKDAALERRFQPLLVEEPSSQSALSILRGLKPRYEIHHGVQITDEALRAAVNLSVRYLTNRRLPDKAIDLIDEAASRLRLQIDSVPSVLDELRSTIEETEIERKAIEKSADAQRALVTLDVRLSRARAEHDRIEGIWRKHQLLLEELRGLESKNEELTGLLSQAKTNGDFDFAAKVQYGEGPKLQGRLQQIQIELDQMHEKFPFLHQFVTGREVAEVVSTWTKVPVGKLLEGDRERVLRVESRLRQRVFGQDNAIALIAQAIKRSRTGISDPRRPSGIFLFLGPTGVGKTETAKALAEELFDDESKMIRLDMSEYMEQHSVSRLIGSPPGYVGFGEGAELTDAVRQRPFCIVLFDEIEKAHPRVLDILLQVFEDGRLTDSQGRVADFRHSILIMTSNLITQDAYSIREVDLRQMLGRSLRPEFVNRIDEIVTFQKLGPRHFESLLERLLQDLNKRVADKQFRVGLGKGLRQDLLANCQGDSSGGRGLRRYFETKVVNAVSDRILEYPDLARGAWTLNMSVGGALVWTEEVEPGRYLPAARNA